MLRHVAKYRGSGLTSQSVRLKALDEMRWNGISQPDTVARQSKDRTVTRHPARRHPKNDRIPSPGADPNGCLRIGRKMNMVPLHGPQTFLQDRVHEPLNRAMIKTVGRCRDGPVKIDRNGVTL